MTKPTLTRAISEAERFLEKAKAAFVELDTDERTASAIGTKLHYCAKGKVLASCRRASMDLSRCLADLRQDR